VGQLKTAALQNYILDRNSLAVVQTVTAKIQSVDDLINCPILQGTDILIGCADKPVGRINSILTEFALRENTPLLLGGVGLYEGKAGPLLITVEEKQNYLLETTNSAGFMDGLLWAPTIASSMGPINCKTGSEMAHLVIKHFVGPF
jgi:uncharacterized protein (UPF0276 family)